MAKERIIFYGCYKVVGIRKKKVVRIKEAKGAVVGKALIPSKDGFVTLYNGNIIRRFKLSEL